MKQPIAIFGTGEIGELASEAQQHPNREGHQARAKSHRLVSYLSSKATVFQDFELNQNCFILEDNTIQPFARIGANVTLWSDNRIGHHSMIEDDVFIASHVAIAGGVRVS